MNVFILCTGRCGSTTFIKACEHITNYSSAHESNKAFIGQQRFRYPEKHIEADNRLAWFLGRLDEAYGDDAFYIHLTRNRDDTASSYAVRHHSKNIITAYRTGILMDCPSYVRPLDICLDFYDTVNSNITCFLSNKTKRMPFRLEHAKKDFQVFWDRIGAEGDLAAALSEWDVSHNSTGEKQQRSYGDKLKKKIVRAFGKGKYYFKTWTHRGRSI